MQQTTGIPGAELGARRERLLEHVRRVRLTGYVLFDQHYSGRKRSPLSRVC